MPEKSLYGRLGGVFAIAAVVDHFSLRRRRWLRSRRGGRYGLAMDEQVEKYSAAIEAHEFLGPVLKRTLKEVPSRSW